MNISLAINNNSLEERVYKALKPCTDFNIKRIFLDEDICISDREDSDVLILSCEMVHLMYTTNPGALLQLMRRQWIVLLLTAGDLRTRKFTLRFAHNWIFVDENLERIEHIVRLTAAGYCVVPETKFPRPAGYGPGARELNKLTLVECALLNELSFDHSDKAIASRLNIPPAVVKKHLGSIFAKTMLGTRKEARQFAARHRTLLQRRRRSLIRQQSGPETGATGSR